MIKLVYKRAGIMDLRFFDSPDDLLDWLIRQSLIEVIEIHEVKKL